VSLVAEFVAELGQEWRADAACRGMPTEDFYPDRGRPGDADRARAICWGLCPVRRQCLDFALDFRERFGIFGGLSEKQRRHAHRARRFGAEGGEILGLHGELLVRLAPWPPKLADVRPWVLVCTERVLCLPVPPYRRTPKVLAGWPGMTVLRLGALLIEAAAPPGEWEEADERRRAG
jgi:WhiB family redox-sensing transcriptional regulator